MDIQKIIENYVERPLPLWENEITQLIIKYKWAELAERSQITSKTYTIVGCVTNNKSLIETYLSLPLTSCDIKIALPSEDLKEFYEKHGLEPSKITAESSSEISKITTALDVFRNIDPINDFIFNIVKSVQLIKSEYPETDISYSHPKIPFSIFFSVCEEVSSISDLRVAESILHEAMHLKLTLIENHVDLIEPNSKETFYSPWRDEERPIRGVLHGIFVFKAIKDFYKLIAEKYSPNAKESQFIKFRIEEIDKEFESLKNFSNAKTLTFFGKKLSMNLLN